MASPKLLPCVLSLERDARERFYTGGRGRLYGFRITFIDPLRVPV